MKLLAIGTVSDIAHNIFTGQSIMFDSIIKYMESHSIETHVVDISSKNRKNNILFRSLEYILILLEILFKLITNRYDLCYITTAQSRKGFYRDYAIIYLCRIFKVPVIIHQFGANYKQLTDALNERERQKLKSILAYSDYIIVEGEYMKKQYSFLEHYEEKVKVIPNGLTTTGKSALRPKTYSHGHPFVMYYLSNMIWSKGYFDVLQAVDILVNKDKRDVKCVFAGKFMTSADDVRPGISSKKDFDKYVEEHHLSSVVSYFPGMYGGQKDEMFAKANVFLLPSYYINEGQPVSIIESMAYGCVPIVTKYRHIPMMVNKENGCFVEARKPEQIAKAVTGLMDYPEVYADKSISCINDYKEKFTFEKYASGVISLMDSIND